MAIQFGYVTMFAAAAPWAATLCLLNNVFERKADALRMLYGQQRPMYEGASNIGACACRIAHHPLETSVAAAQVWLHKYGCTSMAAQVWLHKYDELLCASRGAGATVFEALSVAAIVTNVAILGVTSASLRSIYGLNTTQVLWVCVILEHVLLVMKFLVQVRAGRSSCWVGAVRLTTRAVLRRRCAWTTRRCGCARRSRIRSGSSNRVVKTSSRADAMRHCSRPCTTRTTTMSRSFCELRLG
jgi:hypothetical protein